MEDRGVNDLATFGIFNALKARLARDGGIGKLHCGRLDEVVVGKAHLIAANALGHVSA